MASKVEICNLALAAIGKQPIVDIQENSESARRCNLMFDPVRDMVLRDFPWQFAKRLSALALAADQTVIGWTYVYAYPNSCVAVRKVASEGKVTALEPPAYDQYNINNVLYIVSNEETAYAEYTTKVTDPTLFDAQFVKALQFALAAEIALPLTGNMQVRNDMINLYRMALAQAQSASALERYETPRQKKSYVAVRRGGVD